MVVLTTARRCTSTVSALQHFFLSTWPAITREPRAPDQGRGTQPDKRRRRVDHHGRGYLTFCGTHSLAVRHPSYSGGALEPTVVVTDEAHDPRALHLAPLDSAPSDDHRELDLNFSQRYRCPTTTFPITSSARSPSHPNRPSTSTHSFEALLAR